MNSHAAGAAGRRRAAVLALVRDGRVPSQDALRRRLRARGFAVTQPTLSRDLRALGLVKTATGYALPGTGRVPPAEAAEEALERLLREFVLSAEAAGGLVVVKTPPAAAAPVARALDEARLPGVVGTVAGDDTIFLATPGAAAARRLERRLLAPLGPLRTGRPARARPARAATVRP
jgi:transcriptional regulator of arginine metabolism